MSKARFDKVITEFCKNDHSVVCEFCPEGERPPYMIYDETHGMFFCKRCQHWKMPNLVDKTTKKGIPFYWTNCPDCKKVNLGEHDQEPFWIKFINGVQTIIQNEAQKETTCTHCNCKFLKKPIVVS